MSLVEKRGRVVGRRGLGHSRACLHWWPSWVSERLRRGELGRRKGAELGRWRVGARCAVSRAADDHLGSGEERVREWRWRVAVVVGCQDLPRFWSLWPDKCIGEVVGQ